MNSAWKKSIVCAAAALVLGGAVSWADEDNDAALKAAPAPVQSAVIQLAGTNKIEGFDSEVEAGKTVYDLEYSVKGIGYEADIDPTGQVLTREVEIDLSIVPPAVIDAAKKSHADGKLDEASIVTAGDKMFYEVDVKVGKDTHEVQVSAGGTVIADTIEAPEADEAGDTAKPGEKAETGEKGDKD